MESWTVINTEEGVPAYKLNNPEYYLKAEEKPEIIILQKETTLGYESGKPEYLNKYESTYKPTYESGKSEYFNKYESSWYKPTHGYGKKQCGKYECGKPEYYKYESCKPECHKYESYKPEYYKYESCKPECYKYQSCKPECGRMPEYTVDKVYGDWEKICEKMERVNLEEPRYYGRVPEMKTRWSCEKQDCCDKEMIKMIKDLITILVGAEQSYEQLGFLCMDERFTLVNTAEYFRLCGLRMRWLANGLIRRSNRLFSINEWMNNTNFENWFKVPTKDELSSNNYTGVMKTLFKITMDAEKRLVEIMEQLVEKMMKTDMVMNSECRFEGFKWFVNFVLPYQIRFVREVTKHYQSIHMCNNGYIFDKCEMRPLVQKVEEFLHNIVKRNDIVPTRFESRRF